MDILVILIVVALLPFVVARPYVGAVLYTALAYLRPQNLVGGIAVDLRLSLWVLVAMSLGLAIGAVRGKEKPLYRTPFFALILVMLGAMFVSTQTAVFPDAASAAWGRFAQLLAGVALTVMLCDTPARLRGVLSTVALSLGTMAILALLDPAWDVRLV